MQENEFDKQVHQKMDGLRLDPADAVWRNVEARLRRQKKRRRFLLWLPVYLGALLLAGYFTWPVFFATNRVGQLSATKQAHSGSGVDSRNKNQSHNKAGDDHEVINSNSKISPENTGVANSTIVSKFNNGKKKNIQRIAESLEIQARSGTKLSVTKAELPRPVPSERPSKSASSHPGTNPETFTAVHPRTQTGSAMLDEQYSKIPAREKSGTKPGEGVSGVETMPRLTREPVPAKISGGFAGDRLINTSSMIPGSAGATKGSTVKLHSPKSGKLGLTLQAGRSSVNNGAINNLFRTSDVSNYSTVAPPNSSPNGNGNTSAYIPPAPLKSGPAFSAGMYYQKQLTRRVAMTAGLNYAFSSSSSQLGQRIDSFFVPQANNIAGSQFSGLFRTGYNSKYVNRYHFVELPVMLQLNLLGKRQTSLSWDVGFSMSRLVATNALHYDNQAQIYYKDNDLFNKTQFNFITGLPVQFYSLNKFSFQVGPQLQYGFSNLSAATGNGNHLIIIGLRAGILMRK